MPSPPLSSAEYPELSRPFFWEWGQIEGRFELIDSLPPEEMISNVRIVPFADDQPVLIAMQDHGMWDHPGGTLEPGESYLEAVERELMEEAGARLLEFHPFGVFHCRTLSDTPYRPHLPYPEFDMLAGYADVELVAAPGNPHDGETITQVAAVDLDEACRRLGTRHDGKWQSEMYRLAASIRSSRPALGR